MAEDVIIRADGLGKKYVIGHEADRERYTALRDVIARSVRGWGRSAWDMARGRPIIAGDETEEFWALKDVSFEIRRGEVVGVIGRNGAGKSTLLKILSRITEPSEGRVTIEGRVASLLEVGTGFHPELTGRENIYLNGAILGMRRAEIRRKFDEIVAFAEVERFLDTPVKRYSSGMYVRLAFAVAAHLEPEILIVDEVLAVGDAEFQNKCLGKLQGVVRQGRTVLFVSHNMAAVSSLCSSGILLRGGRIAFHGAADSAIARYTHSSEINYSIVIAPHPNRPSICEINVDREALVSRDLFVDIGFVSPQPLSIAVGGIVLRAVSGEPIWGSNNQFHCRQDQIKGLAEGTLRCEARNLPIAPGEYLLSVWLSDWHETYDTKIDILRINLGFDQVETLRPPSSAIGHIDWPAVWCDASNRAKVNA